MSKICGIKKNTELFNQRIFILSQLISRIDQLLSVQLSTILHHPRFEKLEASWRSLAYLVAVARNPQVKIKILNINHKLFCHDLTKAIEFDQSALFSKVYCEEFGMPGGEPFGVLVGDYEFSQQPDDIEALQNMAAVAAAAFAPFVTGTAASLFGLNHITELATQPNLENIFKKQHGERFEALRNMEDARFLGITLPHFVVRLPYSNYAHSAYGFCFKDACPEKGYLWGNAGFAFAAVLIRAFLHYGWLAQIRGGDAKDEGGYVPELFSAYCATDKIGLIRKFNTDVLLTDSQERELSKLGFIALCQAYGGENSIFYSNASMQKVPTYSNLIAQQNAKAASMLQYILCASRFAHYLKIIGRDQAGSFLDAQDCENHLMHWLLNYVAGNKDLSYEKRARYPLQEAKVQVKENPHKSGCYLCTIWLKPYFQLEQVVTAITLVTELKAGAN